MSERRYYAIYAVAGVITGVVGGILFLSWTADTPTKLALLGGLMLILVWRRGRRLLNAAAFLTSAGLVSVVGLLTRGERAAPTDMLAAAAVLAVGVALAIVVIRGVTRSGDAGGSQDRRGSRRHA